MGARRRFWVSGTAERSLPQRKERANQNSPTKTTSPDFATHLGSPAPKGVLRHFYHTRIAAVGIPALAGFFPEKFRLIGYCDIFDTRANANVCGRMEIGQSYGDFLKRHESQQRVRNQSAWPIRYRYKALTT